MFKKILIANRGEIACRVIKTAKKMGIKTVAICSDPDVNSPHVNLADEFVNIGGNTSAESYLVVKKLLKQLKIQMQMLFILVMDFCLRMSCFEMKSIKLEKFYRSA